ncbi:MAG: hypothetical protein GX631_03715 [Dehalococcoidales bacterium]|nr:hypothetical protein [Dehalococcoidales bacterium]
MEHKKYWRNVVKGPFFKDTEPGMSGMSIFAHHNEYKNGTTLGYHCINSNYEALIPHSHDFHELLCFIGGNPEDINDLGAEVRICLGDEQEEHIITSAAIVSIPPGLKHCPLRVTKLTRPFVFLEVSTTAGYNNNMEEGVDVLLNPPEAPQKKTKKEETA